jgi:carbon-monoxide dehydrogenase large subunit
LAPIEAEGSHTGTAPAFTYGACCARVQVDPETGFVALLELAIAVDVGVAINPEIVRGQLIGGAIHGAGGALFEAVHYDADGQPQTEGVAYHIPAMSEVPPVRAIVLERVPSPRNPLGIRGVGEIATAGAAAAVANAVGQAVRGSRVVVNSIPVVSERLVAPPTVMSDFPR